MSATSEKILLIGEIMLDEYFEGNFERISPEAPVPIIDITKNSFNLGGAGNVINNLHSLNANFDIIGFLGLCDTSKIIKKELSRICVSTNYLFEDDSTIMPRKTRLVSGSQQIVRFDREIIKPISEEVEKKIRDCFKEIINNYSILIISDYGKGLFTNDFTKFLIKKSNQAGVKVIVDPKGVNYEKYTNSYCITPNKMELEVATNISIDDEDSIGKALSKLKELTNVSIPMATLSEKGIAFYDDKLEIYTTKARDVADVTGAGDTVVAALSSSLVKGSSFGEAVDFANYAAGLVVEKPGVVVVTEKDVHKFQQPDKKQTVNKIIKFQDAKSLSNDLKRQGKSIVFTNGCFDIIHAGHTDYLNKSKDLGDTLIIGLNSDSSIKKLKGKDRPINTEKDRAAILSSLASVDYVIIFEQDTPLELIEEIEPNILTKGQDYKLSEVIGSEYASEVILIPLKENKSTTNTIKKIIGD